MRRFLGSLALLMSVAALADCHAVAGDASDLAVTTDPACRVVPNGSGYAFVFTNAAAGAVTFTPSTPLSLTRALLVGGGGSGGAVAGGGGGAGGVVQLEFGDDAAILDAGRTVTITVGAGGVHPGGWNQGGNGGDSILVYNGKTVTAIGGGGGSAWNNTAGLSGGCGGGAMNQNGNYGKGQQGGNGGSGGGQNFYSGGGGGAAQDGFPGRAGEYSGNGGCGITNDITGVAVVYAGGGGGGAASDNSVPGVGGEGGGGNGRANSIESDDYTNGIDGLGGGGGGGAWGHRVFGDAGGNGGCGTVILLVAPLADKSPSVASFSASVLSPTSAVFSAILEYAGGTASSADITFAFGPAGTDLPAGTVVKSGWASGETWTLSLDNLLPATEYAYSVSVTNSNGDGMSQPLTGTFETWRFTTDDDSYGAIATPEGTAYVFTNAAAGTIKLTPAIPLVFNRALLVGGGGAGGWTIGGGGGGGGVVAFAPEASGVIVLAPGREVTIEVGAGGDNLLNPDTQWPGGLNGGDSTLAFGAFSFRAIGGGGGGSWCEANGKIGGCGGGSCRDTRVIGKQGFDGGVSLSSNCSGGGGGAGEAGHDGGSDAEATGGYGGCGITNDITGVAVCYAGGGGAGAGINSEYYGLGGAGGGGHGARKDINENGENGVDGLGGGGGGGSFGGGSAGGRGGCGTVIVSLGIATGAAPVVGFAARATTPGSATLFGDLATCGDGASFVDLYLAYAPTNSALPEATLVRENWRIGESVEIPFDGLIPGETYAYACTVINNLGESQTVVQTGTVDLTTAPECYISAEGSDDTGNGSASAPFRTFTHALPMLRSGGVLHATAGLYDTAAGEVFPLCPRTGVTVEGVLGEGQDAGDSTFIDVGRTAFGIALPVEESDEKGELSGLVIANALGCAIDGGGWSGTIRDCVVESVADAPVTAAIFSHGATTTSLVFTNCVFRDTETTGDYWFAFFNRDAVDQPGSIVFLDCEFRNLVVDKGSANPGRTGPIRVGTWEWGRSFNTSTTFEDCIFDGLVVKAVEGEISSGAWQGCAIVNPWCLTNVRRCVFSRCAAPFAMLGTCFGTLNVDDSLFFAIDCGDWGTVRTCRDYAFDVRGCTFDQVDSVFCTDGYTPTSMVYNVSISSSAALNAAGEPGRLVLANCNVHDTQCDGQYCELSTAVTSYAPAYKARYGSVPAGSEKYWLSVGSALLDAGDAGHVRSELDLYRTARVKEGPRGMFVDIGCCERDMPMLGTLLLVR